MPTEVKFKSQKTILLGWTGNHTHPEWLKLTEAIDARLARNASPVCNMYTFRGEGALLREGIESYWAVGDDDSFRTINPHEISMGGSVGHEEYWSLGPIRLNAPIVPEMESDEPIFDAHDNFVAGTAIRIDGNWHIATPRPGAGVIVRVNTGRCAKYELRSPGKPRAVFAGQSGQIT